MGLAFVNEHFGRSESDVGVTLLHEMLHIQQHLHGQPGKRRQAHNRQFVDMAGAVGIESHIGNGCTINVTTKLRDFLAAAGLAHDLPLMPGTDDNPIKRPVRKIKWACGCGQAVWADRDVAVRAICANCHSTFAR